jgi:hypothetical protein
LIEDLRALVFEGFFDTYDVLLVSGSESFVLLLHLVDEHVDVVVHGAHRFDVLLVLALELLHELINEVFLIANNLLALILLEFDFLQSVTQFK